VRFRTIIIDGVAVFLGSATGGWLASRLPPFFGYQLIGLFVLSGFCRLLVCISLSARFQVVRRAREVSIRELFFSVVGIRPLVGRRKSDSTNAGVLPGTQGS